MAYTDGDKVAAESLFSTPLWLSYALSLVT